MPLFLFASSRSSRSVSFLARASSFSATTKSARSLSLLCCCMVCVAPIFCCSAASFSSASRHVAVRRTSSLLSSTTSFRSSSSSACLLSCTARTCLMSSVSAFRRSVASCKARLKACVWATDFAASMPASLAPPASSYNFMASSWLLWSMVTPQAAARCEASSSKACSWLRDCSSSARALLSSQFLCAMIHCSLSIVDVGMS
mmetsp:Transcript_1903/g.4171  ORF Transcript_1903/g.4171 Transcript_1903/m.4171 type:complete len:202 (+) Transcript_1903:247-852(+)